MTAGMKKSTQDNDLLIRAKSTENSQAVEELFQKYGNLLRSFANKYRSNSLSYEDAYQVAALGLLKALERFDPQRGNAFTTFAYPTIAGELMKHYRDHVEVVRIPRKVRDLRRVILMAQDNFRQQRRREPTIREIAHELEIPEEEVIEALATASNTYTLSLDMPIKSEKSKDGLLSFIGYDDAGFENLETRMVLEEMIEVLPNRLRQIIEMRLEALTQREIAEIMGISQMEVSRMQKKALGMMIDSTKSRTGILGSHDQSEADNDMLATG